MGDYKRGFLTHGLFRVSRHPNYAAEIGLWGAFHLFGVACTAPDFEWVNIGGLGAPLLTLRFLLHTPFAERILTRKYPAYSQYRTTTSCLVPWLPGPPLYDFG